MTTMPHSILEALWMRTINPASANASVDSWDKEMKALYESGISMEEAIHYLYGEKPGLETFMRWVDNRSKAVVSEEQDLAEDVLSADDLASWKENGYIVVRNAISAQQCEATRQAIWDFLEMDPANKETWYKRHEQQKGLMLNFSNHETLNKNRFSPKIKKAYEQLYQTTAIHRTIDKVSFNPPETSTFRFMGSPLHWDVSLGLPIPFTLQGLLYLTDCGRNDGAFHCVPGFHTQIETWLNGLDPSEDPRELAARILQPIPITGIAGDFIIWQNTLPHCAMPNHGTSPRMVQYLTYLPDELAASSVWI